jgi:hypothetical protein
MNSNIIQSFKNVFIAQRNSGYLFDLVVSKILRNFPNYNEIIFANINKYRENIINLQELIFTDSFVNIYNNLFKASKSENVDLEEVLIELNKITVSKFEIILHNDLKNKFTQKSSEYNQVTQKPSEYNQVTQVTQKPSEYNQVTQKPSESNQVTQKSIKENIIMENDVQDNYKVLSRQFCSEDAVFENGKYSFQFFLNNVQSINLDNIKIKCNMYNINEYNNKFYLLEQNSKTIITIPMGYYDIDTLLKTITSLLNNVSINKNKDYKFNVYNNKIKNRVFFVCESKENERLNKNTMFGLLFKRDKNYINYSLSDMLGFERDEYFNNNIYVAELHPIVNIYDEVYTKIFLNNKEIRRYSTSKKDFYYFDTFDLDMDKDFGKGIQIELSISPFEITENNFDIKDISIQFNNTYDYYIHNIIPFKCILTFEYVN